MSKAAKQSVFILIALLVLALGFGVTYYMNSGKLEEELKKSEQKLFDAQSQFQLKEKKNAHDAKVLNGRIANANKENSALTEKIKTIERQAEQKAQELSARISEITDERDKWKRRIDTIRKERDELMEKIGKLTKKLAEKPEPQIIYKEKEPEGNKAKRITPVDVSKAPSVAPDGRAVDEQYWADLLKEKASLEVDMEKLKEELSKKSIEIVEMKQSNEDLKLETDTLKHEKEEIEAELQHKADMLDNISLELARTKNDKKFIADRVTKLNDENGGLRRKLKQLVSVKNALEKSIVRITQEKDKIEHQLGRTETLIQSKVDEIWDIKEELDQSIRSAQANASSNEVELPPIVVSSSGQGETVSFDNGEAAPNFNGRVISLNESNNFVIVDVGEGSGVRLGDHLSVYRDSKYIARLEVIQVRKDISAADIKDQWSKIKVGDVIR